MIAIIDKAIRASDLGLNPIPDTDLVRLPIPPLTQDRRKDLVKSLNQRAEEGRIVIRNVREDIWKEIQEKEKAGEISEDDKFFGKEELQKMVDEYNHKLESLRKKKEEEILTV